jgi:two-component system, LuxR family, response regulator FixJ
MSSASPTVYVVDDDPQTCESLSLMVRSVGLDVETYPSAEAFLDGYRDGTDVPKCMVLDVRMPGLSGLGLQQSLASEGKNMPIVMISGCATIPTVVQAMSAGAVDFLEKPFSRRALLTCIQEALDKHARLQRATACKADLTARAAKFTTRQREVFDLLLAGKRSKQIANQLGIGEKTVAKHRAMVLEKMGVESVVELIRLFADGNQRSSASASHSPLRN